MSNLSNLAGAMDGGGVLLAAVELARPQIEVLGRSGVQQHFQTGAGPDGQPWPALHHARPGGGNKPLRDKGLLAASCSVAVAGTEMVFRANAPGARLHQFGGTVVPVNAKALTIPLTREAARVPGPRSFPRSLFVAGRFLAERVGRAAKLVRHYLFADSVTVQARPYLGVSDPTAQKIGAAIGSKVPEVLADRIRGV